MVTEVHSERNSADVGNVGGYAATTRRVLLFSYAYPPAQASGIFRTLRFVRYLPSYGWTPLVLTARPECLHHKRLDPALDEWSPPGTVVERTAVFRPISKTLDRLKSLAAHRENGIARLPEAAREMGTSSTNGFSGWRAWAKRLAKVVEEPFSTPDAQLGWTLPAVRAGLQLVRRHRPSVLYSSGPPHSSHLIALIVKSLTRLPLVIDFRDPWAHCDWQQEAGFYRDHVNPLLERVCVKHADSVILNTCALRERFCQVYGKLLHHKFAVVPNGYDPELRDRAESLLREQASPRCRKVLRFCHPGAVYGQRSIEPLVEALKSLASSSEAVSFEQIGYVDAKPELVEDIKNNRLNGLVTLLGQQPHGATLQRMASADAFVIIQPGTSTQVPAKLYEMLPFRKPILALTHPGETASLILRYDLGVVASPDSHEDVAAGIRQLAQKIDAKYAFGWRDAMDAFEGRKLTGELAAILDSLSRHKARAD